MDNEVGKLIEPAPVAFSFSAPGWYVVGGLFLLSVFLVMYLIVRRYISNQYRRKALIFLADIEHEHCSAGEMVYETNMLIKRIAMSRYGRQRVSALRADEWILLSTALTENNHLITKTLY
jgi:hypothetical protein